MAAAAPFAVFFTGQSYPIPSANFTQADPTHWVRAELALRAVGSAGEWPALRPAPLPHGVACLPLPPGLSPTQVLDTTSAVCSDWHQLQEAALFLTQPGALPPDAGLAL